MAEQTIMYLTVSAFSVFVFLCGFKLGQRTNSPTKETQSKPNPIKTVKDYMTNTKANKEMKIAQERIDIQMANIDAYDGTSNGQKEID